MTWLLAVALGWLLLALPIAMVIGRGIRLAEQRTAPVAWTDEVERFLRDQAPVRQ